MAEIKRDDVANTLLATGVFGHVLGGVFIGWVISQSLGFQINVSDISNLISAGATSAAAVVAIIALNNWKKPIRYEKRLKDAEALVPAFEDWKKALRKYAYAQEAFSRQGRLPLHERMPNVDLIRLINESRADIAQAMEVYKFAWISLGRWIGEDDGVSLVQYESLDAFTLDFFNKVSKCKHGDDFRNFNKVFLLTRFDEMWTQIKPLIEVSP